MALRPRMIGWYNPPRLVTTAIRVAVSTVFGEFADRREALAAAREIDPHQLDKAYDYRRYDDQEFWLDFVADNGDGWNPTYAIARLLAESQLAVKGLSEPLPLARVLIMGGDQVYPTASRKEYQQKLITPFEMAARGHVWPGDPPDLYAIPGNHDWYDGLLAFLGVFCRRRKPDVFAPARGGRVIGGRRTQQTRSYFALALPHDWWLWGLDVQLKGYVDRPQIGFFEHVAMQWMKPRSRVILCTGQPIWTNVDIENQDSIFKNFTYMENVVRAKEQDHQLRVVLTGDSHHYSRYEENGRQYITAGGGGAFLHPTHHLQSLTTPASPRTQTGTARQLPARSFKLAQDASTGQESLFPDKKSSHRLSYRGVFFAAFNWQYTLTLGLICAFFAWFLHAQATYINSSLLETLASQSSFLDTVRAYLALVSLSPLPFSLVLLATAGYYYLADFRTFWPRAIVGTAHAFVQTVSVMLATCLLAGWMTKWSSVLLIVAVGAVGGVLSATILGLYFLLCLNTVGRHWNEAFSALRIQDYKCFLRLCILPDGTMRIYPVGLERVPRDDRADPPRNPPLAPHLIEKPIEVR